jgi:metallo-beta-lactamase family protein
MKLSFHGANRTVTGSCHLIECQGLRILIDCGLNQGGSEAYEENFTSFEFDPSKIDFLILTHAHLDHCGRMPLLYKRGFRGEVIATGATRELVKLVLLDSASLQEEEAKFQERKEARHGKKTQNPALYGMLDTLNSFDTFGRTACYRQAIELTEGVRMTFFDAGHILGSASVYFELTEGGQSRKLLFSGDIGSADHPLLQAPETPNDCDVVVMETTYGDRCHKALLPSIEELYTAIKDTFRHGGNVIIPTFAMERAQELLYFLREGIEKGLIPRHTQVFLDSPMAISATEIFKHHSKLFAPKTKALFDQGIDPFHLEGLHFVKQTSDSMALNRIKSGAVIMAGSGMCNGGRVRHHLKHNLWRSECSVVFVGYTAQGTLARRIIDGAQSVSLFREEIPVNARIYTINGFSAHADQKELLAWHAMTGKPSQTFLVHGEERAMLPFSALLKNTEVFMPEKAQSFDL